MKVRAFMDIYESLNSILVTLFNDIMNIEEKALITDEFKDISVTDMHIIEAIGIDEPRTMSIISKALGALRCVQQIMSAGKHNLWNVVLLQVWYVHLYRHVLHHNQNHHSP